VSDVFKVQRAHDPSKDGYRFEDHLNRDRSDYLNPQIHTQEHPFRFVLRKVLDEKADLLWLQSSGDWRIDAKRRDAKFDIDLFAKYLGPEYGDRRKAHVDFSVVAHFDEKARRWSIAFQTDNDDTGIIATTNRVYMAPTTGYAKRVEVPQEMYTDRSFTVYLYTRKPKVYVMMQFSDDQLQASTNNWAQFSFDYEYAWINPTGSPLMEFDEKMVGNPVMRGVSAQAIKSLLEDHRYPPRPDMKARWDNRRKWQELEEEGKRLSAQIKKDEEETMLLEKNQNQGSPDAQERHAQLKRKILDEIHKMRNCSLEQSRLNQEIRGLFLPESTAEKDDGSQRKSVMTEKDKYPKKTQ